MVSMVVLCTKFEKILKHDIMATMRFLLTKTPNSRSLLNLGMHSGFSDETRNCRQKIEIEQGKDKKKTQKCVKIVATFVFAFQFSLHLALHVYQLMS